MIYVVSVATFLRTNLKIRLDTTHPFCRINELSLFSAIFGLPLRRAEFPQSHRVFYIIQVVVIVAASAADGDVGRADEANDLGSPQSAGDELFLHQSIVRRLNCFWSFEPQELVKFARLLFL